MFISLGEGHEELSPSPWTCVQYIQADSPYLVSLLIRSTRSTLHSGCGVHRETSTINILALIQMTKDTLVDLEAGGNISFKTSDHWKVFLVPDSRTVLIKINSWMIPLGINYFIVQNVIFSHFEVHNKLQWSDTKRNIGAVINPRWRLPKQQRVCGVVAVPSSLVYWLLFIFLCVCVRNPRISVSRYCSLFQITLEVKWGSGCVNRPTSAQIWCVFGISFRRNLMLLQLARLLHVCSSAGLLRRWAIAFPKILGHDFAYVPYSNVTLQ
jgi:hypothetical protein